METKRTAPQSTDPAPYRASKMPRTDTSPLSSSLTEQLTEKQSALGKICLICDCVPDPEQGDFSYDKNGNWMDCCLFLLDLDAERAKKNGDAYVPRNPNVCFSTYSLGVDACCVLGSILYLFGEEKTDLFSYKLPSHPMPQGFITLTEDMLEDVGHPMKFFKFNPRGCQTPNGKMLVLSCSIDDRKENSGKFEVFDPDEGWIDLPDLLSLPDFPDNTVISIRSYSFINNEPVLLITTSVGNFTLDIERPENGWSSCNKFQFQLCNFPRFTLTWDSLCLMDWFALLDGTSDSDELIYPGLQREGPEFGLFYYYRSWGSGITWLPPSNNRFCVARSHVDLGTLQPHLIIDVCSFDGDFQSKSNQTYDVVPGVTVMERFKFVLGPQERHFVARFGPSGLFSITWIVFMVASSS